MNFNPNTHLSEVLRTYATSSLKKTYQEACNRRRNEVIGFLQKEFGKELAQNPFSSGSTKKGTAISLGYDLDLILPFKHQALGGLQKAFTEVGKALQRHFQKDSKSYRKQRVSHALKFSHQGKDIRVETVPAMACLPGGFENNHDLLLWDSNVQKTIKTNLHQQVNYIKKMEEREKEIIRLLKGWKSHKNAKCSSYLLELMVSAAFQNSNSLLKAKLFDRLLGVLLFIKKEFPKRGFRDWGNKSNDVKSSLTPEEQNQFYNQVSNLFNRLQTDSSRVKEFFPKRN